MSQYIETTNQLLRIIIALLLEESEAFPKLRQRVDFLDRAGLKPSDIAKVLGRTGNYVSKELAGIRRARR